MAMAITGIAVSTMASTAAFMNSTETADSMVVDSIEAGTDKFHT